MFVGREKELASLEKLYQKEKFQMVVLYGRRRMGKTTLITRFIEGKPAIFFTAQETNDKLNLEEFSKKVYRFFSVPEPAGAFQSWNAAFDFLAERAKKERFILAFDEFPYAAYANPGLSSILQNTIDHKFKDTGLYIILCGSQISFMENEVLGYKSPLFGRRTAQIKLEGLDYYDAAKMLPGFSPIEQLQIYSCVGGTPHYLAQIDNEETFEENMERLFFDISGYLYNEPMMLLQQELREPAMYNSIIRAIASGANRNSEIAARVGETGSTVNKYIRTLMDLHIITKTHPFGEDPETSKKAIYRLADNCYLFWYRFVFPVRQEIESGSGDIVAKRILQGEQMSDFFGKPAFEDISLQFLRRMNRTGKLPFTGTSFGTWWGNDSREKKQADIDVIMADRENRTILLGECKWRNASPELSVLREIAQKDYLMPAYKEFYHCVFSKIPYSVQAKELGKQENILLFDVNSLYDF